MVLTASTMRCDTGSPPSTSGRAEWFERCSCGSGRAGELVAHETRSVVINLYTADELVASLASAGFVDLDVVGGYHGGEPDGSERFLVYIARRPAPSG